MSSISMDVPTLQINGNDLQNFVSFIYKHERLLKEFGAIKIQPNIQCKLALKKRRMNVGSRPTAEQIVKIGKSEPIYYAQKVNHIDEFPQKHSLETDECNFWSSLSCSSNNRRHLNISLLPNKSFFSQRRARICFDIHRLPNQSLLKLGGSKLTRQFVPCLRRAHGPGSIFPLTSARQRLFSLNYHHEGGAHHWYIIPTSERDALRKLIDQQDSSICLDHGQLFIDPSVLDKNHIRYYRILQHPNEFIVFSAGTLAQCFTEDASWSESISFALPSWIEEGHANVSDSLCSCDILHDSLSETIDLTLFRRELIQRYIISQLNINNYDKSLDLKDYNYIDMVTIPTPNSIETISSNDETPVSTYSKVITPHQPMISYFQSPATSLIAPSVSSYHFEDDKNKSDDKNVQVQYELLEEGTMRDLSDWNSCDITMMDSISDENLEESNTTTKQLYQTISSSSNIHENITNHSDADNYFLSFEDLMDLLPNNADHRTSTYQQIDQNNNKNVSLNRSRRPVNNLDYVKNKRRSNNHKILFVSGLKKTVNKTDIHTHFIGSRKITIKQYRTTSELKYAFVSHGTSREAERNLRRPVNFRLLGSKCRVEYANNYSAFNNNNHHIVDKRKLMVARIPENVNEKDLQNLFTNCHLLKYCPARSIHRANTTTKMKNKTKILWGYAFLLYDDEQQATNVIKHADQYRINGQTLVISVYRDRK